MISSLQDDPMYEVGLDIKSQLRVFEQIDEVERKKRDARERDILMRAAKVSVTLLLCIHVQYLVFNFTLSDIAHFQKEWQPGTRMGMCSFMGSFGIVCMC